MDGDLFMDNKDKKGKNKYNFVSLEDENDTKKESNEKIENTSKKRSSKSSKDNDEKITITKVEEKENDKVKNSSVDSKKSSSDVHFFDLGNRIHYSFETRIIVMSISILVLFGVSCFFILEALNFGKNKIVSYSENGKMNYKVCLVQNEFYTDQCLDEGMQYVSDMISHVYTQFNYDVLFSSPVEDYDLSYHVSAVTKIYDKNDVNKVLYQNEEILIDKTKIENNDLKISIANEVNVDYPKYNSMVLDYNTRYGLDSLASLDIILYLDETTEVRNVASISIPLGNQTFGITKNVLSNNNKSVEINNDTWNDYNSVCAFFATFFIVIALLLLYRATRLVLKVTNNKNKYQAKIQQLLREYDRIIVIARSGYESNVEKNVIKVATFDELLNVRETLKKPIIFSKVNDVKCEFIVEDSSTLYKYILKEADL